MKTLKDFKTNEINCSKVNGGDLIPVTSGSGIFRGMYYDRDEFMDSDHDGLWDSGETLSFYYDKVQEGMG